MNQCISNELAINSTMASSVESHDELSAQRTGSNPDVDAPASDIGDTDPNTKVLNPDEFEFELRCYDNGIASDASSLWGTRPGDDEVAVQINTALPGRYQRRIEPFVGRGSLFWPTCFEHSWQTVVLGDLNPLITLVYATARTITLNSRADWRRWQYLPKSHERSLQLMTVTWMMLVALLR